MTLQNNDSNLKPDHKRNINLDIIRIFAFLCIPFAHFFLNTGFYSIKVNTPSMMVLMCLRNICLSCIPLFMMLTGYLQGTKDIKPDKKYYAKTAKFLIPYLITSLLILILEGLLSRKIPSVLGVIKGFTTFTGYSWYVEMYIGVFIFIPFLNMFYNSIKTKKQEKFLIFALIFFTLLPSVVNTYSIGTSNWLFGKSESFVKIIPDFWKKLYPITFYYTGTYMRKHKDEMKLVPFKRLILLLGTVAASSLYCIVRNLGKTPGVYSWISRNSFVIYLIAVAIFFFLISIDFSKTPKGFARFLGKISELTFSAYLCSYLADKIVYRYLMRYTTTFSQRLLTLPLTVSVVIVCSLAGAFVVDFITSKVCIAINRSVNKSEKKETNNE